MRPMPFARYRGMPGGGGGTPRWAAFHPFVFGFLFGSIGAAAGVYLASRNGFNPAAIRTILILGAIGFVLGVVSGFMRRLIPGP